MSSFLCSCKFFHYSFSITLDFPASSSFSSFLQYCSFSSFISSISLFHQSLPLAFHPSVPFKISFQMPTVSQLRCQSSNTMSLSHYFSTFTASLLKMKALPFVSRWTIHLPLWDAIYVEPCLLSWGRHFIHLYLHAHSCAGYEGLCVPHKNCAINELPGTPADVHTAGLYALQSPARKRAVIKSSRNLTLRLSPQQTSA